MNPIIFLWAHPRSMSTAIERIMRERGDFDCPHEPFPHYYHLQRAHRPLPHFDDSRDHPRGDAETRDLVLEAEAVQRDPLASMNRFRTRLGLECRTHALAWESGKPLRDWRYLLGRQRQVSASSGIIDTSHAAARDRRDEFERLCRQVPRLERCLQRHLPFHEKVRKHPGARAE